MAIVDVNGLTAEVGWLGLSVGDKLQAPHDCCYYNYPHDTRITSVLCKPAVYILKLQWQ